MTQTKSPRVLVAATTQGPEVAGTCDRTDEAKFTPWRSQLQTWTRGTHLHPYSKLLEAADALALPLWARTP